MIYDLLPLYGLVCGFGLGSILTALYYHKKYDPILGFVTESRKIAQMKRAMEEFNDKENERKQKFGY